MDKINLEGRIIEVHFGRNIDIAPVLLERWKKGRGFILSEADIMLYRIKNKYIRYNYWDSSTPSATKGEEIKVILPYGTREILLEWLWVGLILMRN